MKVKMFTFNAFQENTYVLYDETNECIIIDPGCSNRNEEDALVQFISENHLKPVKLVNTHCHIDHVLGNRFVADTYNLPLTSHPGEAETLFMQDHISGMYGMAYNKSPEITEFLEEGDTLAFGNTEMSVLFTPGHSPASISFYNKDTHDLIAGDVLFQGSIGRTDLPGGDYDTLISHIKNKFMMLPDDVIVYSGHGPSTTIGRERMSNPFLQD